MKALIAAIQNYFASLWGAWNQFWFAPSDPATLCLLRVLTGAMLLYTHLVWSVDLPAFFGPDGFLSAGVHQASQADRFFFSYFDYLGSGWLLWTVHILNLAIFAMLMVGLFSRTVAVLAFITALMYVVRVTPGAFFGLDKINCMLAMYIMLGPCGARYSVDRLWRLHRGNADNSELKAVVPTTSTTVAIRLIQLHMCVIYLFSGLGKLQGVRWWDGSATWFSVASVEYRSWDMTWMADYLYMGEFLAHTTVFWELFYCCLVWNRFARPWVLLAAVGAHGFIAACLGMITFGLVMLFGNLAFVSSETVRWLVDPIARRVTLAIVGDKSPAVEPSD